MHSDRAGLFSHVDMGVLEADPVGQIAARFVVQNFEIGVTTRCALPRRVLVRGPDGGCAQHLAALRAGEGGWIAVRGDAQQVARGHP